MLGEVVAGIGEIIAIVQGMEEIIKLVNQVMEEVKQLIIDLNSVSEGSFAEKLDVLANWMLKAFRTLINSLNVIAEKIRNAMKLNEQEDANGAALLAGVIH